MVRRKLRKKHGKTETLEKIVLNILQNQMKVDIKLEEVDRARRVGKQITGKDRMIIVSFTTIRRKLDVLAHRQELRGTSIRLQEDFPKEVVETRKLLYTKMKSLRQQGRKAVLRYDKLYVDGCLWEVQEETSNQKRKPSLSPQVVETRNQKRSKSDGITEENDDNMSDYNTDSEEFASPYQKHSVEDSEKKDE